MKLVSYLRDGHDQLAFLVDDFLYDCDALHPDLPGNMNMFLNYWDDMFETAKSVNNAILQGIITKDKGIDINTIQSSIITLIQQKFKSYLEDIFGLLPSNEIANSKLNEVMNLLIEIRKEAKIKKDFATSDKIRNQLAEMGINLKDEKGGEMTWSL